VRFPPKADVREFCFRPKADTLGLTQIRDRNERSRERYRFVPRFYFRPCSVQVRQINSLVVGDINVVMQTHAARQARVTFGETAKDEGRVVLHHRIDIETSKGPFSPLCTSEMR
jgi:hypothetical protein